MACEDAFIYVQSQFLMVSHRFRWVSCQLEILRHCVLPNVRSILAELPETLDATYERILQEIPKSNRVHAHRLLQCLAAAVRPLRVKELAAVLAIDFNTSDEIPKLNEALRWEDQEQAVLSACSSLIAVIKDGNSRMVQISHLSVKEFLTSDRLATSKIDASRYHHILLEPAHTIMARACLSVLLRFGSNIDKATMKNFPLAEYAAEHFGDHAEFRHRGLANYLISKRPDDVNVRGYHRTPLLAALGGAHAEIARLLLGYCVDVDVWDYEDVTPLHLAAYNGFLGVVRTLVERNADINARDSSGNTSLHRAMEGFEEPESVQGRSIDVVELLLVHGADPNAKNDHHATPLHQASYYGSVKGAQLMLEHGADVHARSWKGRTPLHRVLASLDDAYDSLDIFVDAMRCLLAHGADVDALDDDHATPLHLASYFDRVKGAQLLLEHGANVHLEDKRGKTPFQVASEGGGTKVMKLLSEYLQSQQNM